MRYKYFFPIQIRVLIIVLYIYVQIMFIKRLLFGLQAHVTFVLLVERFPRDCQDILWEGYSESKVYKIYPQGSGELDVFCDQHTDGGGWTVCYNCYLLMRSTYQFQISMFSCATCNISKICVSLLFL